MKTVESAIRWTPAYSVNISLLDRQHKKLFVLLAELSSALSEGEGQAVIDSVLRELIAHAESHFGDEESLMAQHGYPGYDTHRAEHEMFRQKIAQFLKDHKSGKPGVPVEVLLFTQDWVAGHMKDKDKQYTAFLNARGVY
jgi:hemerythrin-like metal-binding protein